MRPVIRTLIAAMLAIVVTAPAFAQDPSQPRAPRSAREQRMTAKQRPSTRAGRARRGVRLRRGLERMDQDGNGAISREEWRRRPQLFDRLDANKDGQLTRDELRGARSTTPGRTPRRIR